MAFSVFISYSTKDLRTAQALLAWVKHAGAVGFLAEYSVAPGRPLATDIVKAIKDCDLFLLLWSTNAQGSEWVPQEIGIAKGAEKQILPVLLQSGLSLSGFLKDLKYLALYKNPKEQVKVLRAHIAELVSKKTGDAIAAGFILGGLAALLLGGKGGSN